MASCHVHERYTRRPMDLPWRGWKAHLVLTVRRFRCLNDACSRSSFAETFGDDLPRSARRTKDATDQLVDWALKAGGEEGARLAKRAGLPTSPDTLLRLIRGLPMPEGPTPRILGVDDLALRRRHSYATLLVDGETHRPVDLLKGREAETLATWLREHPGVEVISRDRAAAYADGASAGAPDAVQVADRFHLLQNASAALDGMLRGRRLAVDDPETPPEEPPDADHAASRAAAGGPVVPPMPPAPLSPSKRYLAERRAARLARWQTVHDLHQEGASIHHIARVVGISRRTVRSLLTRPEPPRNRVDHRRPGGLSSPKLGPYVSYLQDRWQEGCMNVSLLFQEIRAQGYPGSRSLLTQAVQPWRQPKTPKGPKKERRRARRMRRRTAMRWICLKPPQKLKTDEHVLLTQLLSQDTELAHGYDLLQGFRSLLKDRDLERLEQWIEAAKQSDIPTFMSLSNSIKADWAAVEAAFRLPWSNGLVEGHVNRVKLIKRQGYGRANFDLLRCRVLQA
jgi:transposase